jgi:hypothetical protein
MLEYVTTHESYREKPGGYDAVIFDQRDETWKIWDGTKGLENGLPSLLPLTAPQPSDDKVTPLNLVTTNHILGGIALTINHSNQFSSEFDPLVSFTVNPMIAIHFTFSAGAVAGQLARLYVLSVSSADISIPSHCDGWLPDIGGLIDVSGCTVEDRENFSAEDEIDAAFVVNPAQVKDILLTPATHNRVPELN